MAAAFEAETIFLQGWAKSYYSEVSWDEEAERVMRGSHGRRLPLVVVRQALLGGRVVVSEKREACGAYWEVIGTTCDGDSLRLALEVHCDQYRVRILKIWVLRSGK